MSEPSEPLPKPAIQQWMEAYKALDHAMQQYLDSTTALRSSLRSDIYVETDFVCDILSKARLHLNQIHKTVSLFNTLPVEILLKMFTYATLSTFHAQYRIPIPFSYEEDDDRTLVSLTHVCSHWRSILISTPWFWSYFRLEPEHALQSECERAKEYFRRAHNMTQSLCLYNNPDRRRLYLRHSYLLREIIESRLNNLTQISLLNFQGTQMVRKTVAFLLHKAKPGVLRTLTIRMAKNILPPRPMYPQYSASVLEPIRTLYLHGITFAWYGPVYHNLLVLHVGSISASAAPTIGQLLNILSSCPLLHTLRLYGMVLHPDHSATMLESVYLTELQYLDLELPPSSIGLLLPSIFPQNKDLSLRISFLDWDGQDCAVIYPFLARTNVTRLFTGNRFDDSESGSVLSQCLSILPNLRTLVLDLGLKPGDAFVSGLVYRDASNTRYLPLCPQLHTIYFVTGSVSIAAVQQMVEIHPLIRKLRFVACYVEPFEDVLRDWLRPYVEDIKFDPRLDTAMLFDWYHLMV